jgi:hypothetical protein
MNKYNGWKENTRERTEADKCMKGIEEQKNGLGNSCNRNGSVDGREEGRKE